MPKPQNAPPFQAFLLISQDPFLHDALSAFLHAHNLPLTLAPSVASAQKIIKEIVVRCILLDGMIEGESGFALAAWLRQQPETAHTDLVFFSSPTLRFQYDSVVRTRYHVLAYLDLPLHLPAFHSALHLHLQRFASIHVSTPSSATVAPPVAHRAQPTPPPAAVYRAQPTPPSAAVPRSYLTPPPVVVHRAQPTPPATLHPSRMASPVAPRLHPTPPPNFPREYTPASRVYPQLPEASYEELAAATEGRAERMEKAASASWPAASGSWSGGASSSLNPTQFLTDPDDWAASVLRRPTEPPPAQEQDASSSPQESEPSAPSAWSDEKTTPHAERPQYPPSSPASYPPPPLAAAPPTPPTPVVPLQQPIARQTPLSQPRAALFAPHAAAPAQTPQPHTAEDEIVATEEDAQSAFKRGFKALAENNYAEALQAFSKAFQQQPSPLYEGYFAWTLFLSDPKHPLQSKIAMMHLEKAKKADPQQEKIYLFLGNIYQQQRRFEEALALYREALQAMPDSREVYREMRLLELQMTRHRGV